MFSSSALGDVVTTLLPTMPPRTARLFAALRSLRPVHAAPCLAAAVGCALLYTGAESARLGRWANPFLVHAHSQAQPVFRVDPETSIEFPVTLSLATPSPPLTLVGLGVRKVSFLKIKVYSAGFYLQEGATRCLHHIPGWANFTAQHLLTPPSPSPAGETAPQLSGEALMANLLDQRIACAVRIVPNRNTDFGHLRDAFTRALIGRQKLERAKGTLSEADEARITEAIQTLKTFFPAQTVHKGKSVTLLRPPEGGIVVEFEGAILGKLNDPWIGKHLILTYFADSGAVSDKLKEDVAKGLEGFANNKQGAWGQ
ncbi:hypothetical protein I307_00795 [Cryptococcus deuterogattii 99/473]|uniref:Chalcone isomerase domain-containing protein n=2 Tax=Cryptococcus deuterogattii TaxID=1859096 RepID=A0A0D0U296_9TREE|nr:hypothetical protein I313_01541 [Cryptococcus deuterogattii Ram5]KIR72857.1 hypothetical protein I310_03460 [Cryptococcus deuterogattii CA1014]KIY59722.1 hypothetical protein I307_00795 [Cryptococcus deuterogattii 99/473]